MKKKSRKSDALYIHCSSVERKVAWHRDQLFSSDQGFFALTFAKLFAFAA